MPKAILTFTFVLVISTSYSQGQWRKSWYLNSTGMTVHGRVFFKDWNNSPSEMTFMDSLSNVEKTIKSEDIKRIVIYHGAEIEIYDGKTFSFKKYQTEPVANGEKPVIGNDKKTSFLQLVFESELIALYRYVDVNRKTHFYVEKESSIVELDYAKVKVLESNKVYVKEITYYRQQLKNLLSDYPSGDYERLSYTDGSMIKLMRDYHINRNVPYNKLIEIKKSGQVNLGLSGLFVPDYGSIYSFNVNVRYLFSKSFQNRFIFVEVGKYSSSYSNLSVYGGTYFGKKKIQPLFYVGFTRLPGNIAIDFGAGVGVSYKKKLDISIQTNTSYLKDNIFGYSLRFYPMLKSK